MLSIAIVEWFFLLFMRVLNIFMGVFCIYLFTNIIVGIKFVPYEWFYTIFTYSCFVMCCFILPFYALYILHNKNINFIMKFLYSHWKELRVFFLSLFCIIMFLTKLDILDFPSLKNRSNAALIFSKKDWLILIWLS